MLNSTMIIGNVGGDSELKELPSGQTVCNFSVAVSESYLDKQGQRQQRTDWFNVSAFSKLGEICGKYCVKGKQVFIEGQIRVNKWEDKAGNRRESINLIANKMKLLGSKDMIEEKPKEPVKDSDPFGDGIPF